METQNQEVASIIEVKNAKKYIVLPDGRMARLLKPVKVKHYKYYSFINDDKKAVRINANNSRSVNDVVEESK